MLKHQIVIVGGGAAGISTAASLLKRQPTLDIAIIEPSESHYYQPGWTMVGGGVFSPEQTRRKTEGLIPRGVKWIKAKVTAFQPNNNIVLLEDGQEVCYEMLVAAPGLKINWAGIEGLTEHLGKNGVTSNYSYSYAPYTWKLVNELKKGRALFTQPPMPIKCAGAPQKAMYLACDAWLKRGVLNNIDVSFHNAGPVLFGVKDYVPALMKYVERYGINLNFSEKLVRIDGDNKIATFEVSNKEGVIEKIERPYDMIHVTPPQCALDFVKDSELANEAGWIEVDQETLQHVRFPNVFALGDATSTPNAKTAAAVRAQVPVVAVNLLRVLNGKKANAVYNGYGSCPLTVERGKIVLAEFGYGGKVLPSMPKWLINGLQPSSAAWFLKKVMLPKIYFGAMLRGKEWLVSPTIDPSRSN